MSAMTNSSARSSYSSSTVSLSFTGSVSRTETSSQRTLYVPTTVHVSASVILDSPLLNGNQTSLVADQHSTSPPNVSVTGTPNKHITTRKSPTYGPSVSSLSISYADVILGESPRHLTRVSLLTSPTPLSFGVSCLSRTSASTSLLESSPSTQTPASHCPNSDAMSSLSSRSSWARKNSEQSTSPLRSPSLPPVSQSPTTSPRRSATWTWTLTTKSQKMNGSSTPITLTMTTKSSTSMRNCKKRTAPVSRPHLYVPTLAHHPLLDPARDRAPAPADQYQVLPNVRFKLPFHLWTLSSSEPSIHINHVKSEALSISSDWQVPAQSSELYNDTNNTYCLIIYTHTINEHATRQIPFTKIPSIFLYFSSAARSLALFATHSARFIDPPGVEAVLAIQLYFYCSSVSLGYQAYASHHTYLAVFVCSLYPEPTSAPAGLTVNEQTWLSVILIPDEASGLTFTARPREAPLNYRIFQWQSQKAQTRGEGGRMYLQFLFHVIHDAPCSSLRSLRLIADNT